MNGLIPLVQLKATSPVHNDELIREHAADFLGRLGKGYVVVTR
jgi:hypothetical protein